MEIGSGPTNDKHVFHLHKCLVDFFIAWECSMKQKTSNTSGPYPVNANSTWQSLWQSKKKKPLSNFQNAPGSSTSLWRILDLQDEFQTPSLPQSAQAAITKYQRLGGLNNTNLFFHHSGGWKSKIRVSEVLWVYSSWLAKGCLLTVSSHGRRKDRVSPLVSLL